MKTILKELTEENKQLTDIIKKMRAEALAQMRQSVLLKLADSRTAA